MIYISNWHTSYSELLSKVFIKANIFREWDFDQRNFPDNFKHFSLLNVFLTIKKGDTLIANKAIYDLPIIIFAMFRRVNIVIVLHGEINRASSGLKLKIKKLFYQLLCFSLPNKERSFVCIQESVRDSFKFKNAYVIQPFVKLRQISEIDITRSVVVANKLSRFHFDKEFLLLVHRNIAPLTVIGRDNNNLKGKYPFKFITPSKKSEFFLELDKGGICINCLVYPEASYNLGILDCIAVGMPLISIYRDDLVFRDGSLLLENNSNSLKVINRKLLQKEFLKKNIKKLRDKASIEFGLSKFRDNWLNAIK